MKKIKYILFALITCQAISLKAQSNAEWGFFMTGLIDSVPEIEHVEWSRITGLTWDKLESLAGSGNYNWYYLDTIVTKAQDRNLNLVFVLKTGNNAIYSDSSCYAAVLADTTPDKTLFSCPLKPAYMNYWKNLVYNIVERYDGDNNDDMPGLSSTFKLDIQIENEAANPQYWYLNESDGVAAADAYINLLQKSYEGKDSAGSSTQIILAGISSPYKMEWCTTCTSRFYAFNNEILYYPQYFDAIDLHQFLYLSLKPNSLNEGFDWLYSKIDAIGYSKPVYCLEYTPSILLFPYKNGFLSEFMQHFPYSSEFANLSQFFDMYNNLGNPANKKYQRWFEKEQSVGLTKIFSSMLARGAERLVYVRFSDYIYSWDNSWWNQTGIVRMDTTGTDTVLIRKPAYYTYNLLSANLFGFDSVQTLWVDSTVFLYKFYKPTDDPVYVAWTTDSVATWDLSSILPANSYAKHIITELDTITQLPIFIPDDSLITNAVLLTQSPILIGTNLVTNISNILDVNHNILKIYPNPSESIYTLQIANNLIIKHVHIYNSNGQLVHVYQEINSDKMLINLTGFPSGIYFVHVVNNSGRSQFKKIILK